MSGNELVKCRVYNKKKLKVSVISIDGRKKRKLGTSISFTIHDDLCFIHENSVH